LSYALEQISAAGIREVGIVISPEVQKQIKVAVGNGSVWNINISFVLQAQPLGLANAVSVAEPFICDSTFLLFLGDNIFQDEVKGLVEEYENSRPEALVVLKAVADPRAFGVAEVDQAGEVRRVVEKPKEPTSDLALAGEYIFTPEIFHRISTLRPSPSGEYEITDAIQNLLERGKRVSSHILTGWWLDTGKKEDLLEANKVVLNEYLKPGLLGEIDSPSRISGRVEIGRDSRIQNSQIEGPVSIAENCHIDHSIIRAYTSIGRSTIIRNSIIDNSIILGDSLISNVDHIHNSVLGREVTIEGKSNPLEATTLFIGDQSQIQL
jgi:glucose-1-phosphate thymidylyltransferase